ncbi:hypothetical protein [Flavobacterium sp. ASW18X]|uniref:hypothetical protein n=1 Tax=Flavobacterium sp. ASW18X TaxID=2572595 RepID=UPI0010AEEA84|nr:hypothetical protein [Flavobacterium sp. ASW18X]TKD60472.1 hypothetical protein FBT53_12760 [Flavobacterium sp. ASW18X]
MKTKKLNFRILMMVLGAVLVYSCSKDEEPKPESLSGENEMLSFQFLVEDQPDRLIVDVDAEIDGVNLNAQVFPLYVASALTPVITVSEGADYSPKGSQDFTEPVTYTVTAEDGTTKSYSVSIEENFTSRNLSEIINWAILDGDSEFNPIDDDIYGEINDDSNSIIFTFPSGSDVSTIDPQIQFVEMDGTILTGGTFLDFSEGGPIILEYREQDGSGLYISFDIAFE